MVFSLCIETMVGYLLINLHLFLILDKWQTEQAIRDTFRLKNPT